MNTNNWAKCDWCRKRNAEPGSEGSFGPFGEDAVCPECQAAYWRGREEADRAYAAGRAMFEGARSWSKVPMFGYLAQFEEQERKAQEGDQ